MQECRSQNSLQWLYDYELKLSSTTQECYHRCSKEWVISRFQAVFNKFTGSRGKSGSNDANAEYLAVLRNIMDNHKFQPSENAYIMSLYGMEVIDCGVQY